MYGANLDIIQALAGTNISLVLGTTNGDIPSLATDPYVASRWVSTNILPFIPSSSIYAISVDNEALNFDDPYLDSNLLPAMQNHHSALSSAGSTTTSIKVSTVHSMAILPQSDPPSSGAFHSDLALAGILAFLHDNGSPFMINPYPYFAYRDDPCPKILAFCVFQSHSGRFDAGSKITSPSPSPPPPLSLLLFLCFWLSFAFSDRGGWCRHRQGQVGGWAPSGGGARWGGTGWGSTRWRGVAQSRRGGARCRHRVLGEGGLGFGVNERGRVMRAPGGVGGVGGHGGGWEVRARE